MKDAHMSTALTLSDKDLALIKRTIAKDTNDDEFRMFVHICKHTRLDPLKKQIYAQVYNKGDASKRQLVIVTSINGYRAIGDRTGCYRPDDKAPRFVYNEALRNADSNPLGIESCEVSPYKFSHGEWHACVGIVYWDELVPLKEEWVEDPATGRKRPNGKPMIDRTKSQWIKSPRNQLAKCAEAAALRKGWPDDFASVYVEEEMDRAASTDAMEAVRAAEEEERRARVGGRGIIVDWLDGKRLESVPVGQFCDRAIAFIEANKDEPMTIKSWTDRNQLGLREFWVASQNDALALKRVVEQATAPRVINRQVSS
jgi:phage recombination protein Bet